MNEAEDMQLRKVAGDMVKSASFDPKLSNTEFMKFVAGLAKGGKADDWSDEFVQKNQVTFSDLWFSYLFTAFLPFFLGAIVPCCLCRLFLDTTTKKIFRLFQSKSVTIRLIAFSDCFLVFVLCLILWHQLKRFHYLRCQVGD